MDQEDVSGIIYKVCRGMQGQNTVFLIHSEKYIFEKEVFL
jgi:hypothetical protein